MEYFPRGENQTKISGRYKSVSWNSVRPLTVRTDCLCLKQNQTNQRSGDTTFFLEVSSGF